MGDFDSDGLLDYLMYDGNISVFIGLSKGDGTFQSLLPSPLKEAACPQLIVADFNNDKKLDLLIARRWQGNLVDIALGNGDGTFRFPYTVVGTSDGATYDVATADFNADGVADLVFTMVSKGPSVQIALGKGDGTFLPTRSFDAGDDADRLSVADLDRDGVPDLVIGTGGANQIEAFLGDGALHNPEDLLVAALSACHCLSFLALAARAGLLCEAYEDHAEGTLGVVQKGLRFTEVRLRPRVTLRRPAAMDGDALTAQVAELHEKAHAQCFIASSVNFPVRHQAELILSS